MKHQTVRNKIGSPNVLVVDIREADEYAYERIAGTLNIPQSALAGRIDKLPKDKEVYVVCNTGARSFHAAQIFTSAGFQQVHNLEGGIESWKKEGLPVERAKGGPIPIMRQVQIAAGSMALIGGLFPSLRWIAVLVGAGLMFAGISGFCGMAKVLIYLPWNKPFRKSSSGSEPDCGSGCN